MSPRFPLDVQGGKDAYRMVISTGMESVCFTCSGSPGNASFPPMSRAGGTSPVRDRGMMLYPAPDPEICGGLLKSSYESIMAILVDNGFDPAEPPDRT